MIFDGGAESPKRGDGDGPAEQSAGEQPAASDQSAAREGQNREPAGAKLNLSKKDIARLHDVFGETNDAAVGRVLDQVCADPGYSAEEDD